jgi:hypothetical protein
MVHATSRARINTFTSVIMASRSWKAQRRFGAVLMLPEAA